MTDRESLFTYRLREAEETLEDAELLLSANRSPRSVVNRSYYAMFYSVLALFNRFDTPHRTSKHAGIIGIFNKEFVHTGKIEIRVARMLNELFEDRLAGDYKGFAELTQEQATESIEKAREFVAAVKSLLYTPS